MPTFDWAAFVQRIFGWFTRAMLIGFVIKVIGGTLFNLGKNAHVPSGALPCVALWFPDTIQWIFMQIGSSFVLVIRHARSRSARPK